MMLAIGEAMTETIIMIKNKTIKFPHFVSGGVVYLLLALTKTNILLLFGLGDGNFTADLTNNDLYWEASYLLMAFIGMRGSGALHALIKAISNLKSSLASFVKT